MLFQPGDDLHCLLLDALYLLQYGRVADKALLFTQIAQKCAALSQNARRLRPCGLRLPPGPGFLLRLPLGQIQPVRRLTRKQARAVRRKVNILIFSRADQSEQIFADGSLAFARKLRKLLQCAVGTLAQHALVCGDTPQRARFEKCAKCACEKPQRNEP